MFRVHISQLTVVDVNKQLIGRDVAWLEECLLNMNYKPWVQTLVPQKLGVVMSVIPAFRKWQKDGEVQGHSQLYSLRPISVM